MARLGRGGFVALAVIFHLVYIYSIFDIYFVSPIVHGMRPFKVTHHEPPAQRLVLFVGDGLRADKAFQFFPDPSPDNATVVDLTPRPLAPFLRSRVLEHGTFGVSHTRVPTESRPGHVALIAGLYEDVSAVATGWKMNPVNFDSVFNRSRHTWSWGSPDILPMFKEGAVPGRVDADQYGHEMEDFTQDATELDIWVFDRVKALFQQAKTNSTLNDMLRQDKIVFFLHLLGLDTSGHSYRPYSKEYLNNIKVVDKGVQEIYSLIEEFYSDQKTAYVFTADHGMTDWGSHGDGHPDSTRTPLIVWGSGAAKPVVVSNTTASGHEDGFSSDWQLNHVQRHDVEQAAVAPLMSYLVGLDFPVNSVGELPLSYLSASEQQKAHAALVNAKQVLEMYRVKEDQKMETAMKFRSYRGFDGDENSIKARISTIEAAIDANNFDLAIQLSDQLLREGIQGLRYLQTYDWLFLRALITIGYLGWIAFGLTTVIDLHVLYGSTMADRTATSTILFSSILIVLYSSFIIDNSPMTYYAYAFFPVFFWEEVFARRKGLISGVKVLFAHVHGVKSYIVFTVQMIVYVAVLQALVQSYFHRIIYTLCYVLGAVWPLTYGMTFIRSNVPLIFSWSTGCLVLSVFTTLSAMKVENVALITAGGVLMFLAGATYLVFEEQITSLSKSGRGSKSLNPISRSIMGLQLGVLLLTIIVTRSSTLSLQAKKGLPLGSQVTGWITLVASLILPFVHRIAPNTHYLHRLVVIFLTFAPSFVILTISYEGLFYMAFSSTLLSWIRIEHAIFVHNTTTATATSPVPATEVITSKTAAAAKTTPSSTTSPPNTPSTFRTLILSDFRTSLFFLFLLQSGFFSTGNVASVSSFSLDAVYRLIPIFDPFSQGALLLFKIMVPFACISAALGILNLRLGLQSSALFMIIMSVSDVMTLSFFWMVKDEGSWLDIGTTISHFVIGSGLSLFVAGLQGVSEALISGVEVDGFEEGKRREGGVDVVIGGGKSSGNERNMAASSAAEAQTRSVDPSMDILGMQSTISTVGGNGVRDGDGGIEGKSQSGSGSGSGRGMVVVANGDRGKGKTANGVIQGEAEDEEEKDGRPIID